MSINKMIVILVDLAENLGKITAPRAKKVHFRLSCVAQKHLFSLKSRGNILPGLSDPQNR